MAKTCFLFFILCLWGGILCYGTLSWLLLLCWSLLLCLLLSLQLFIDERVTNRADDIANRLDRDFSIVSPEWRTWVNKTAQYNATCKTLITPEWISLLTIRPGLDLVVIVCPYHSFDVLFELSLLPCVTVTLSLPSTSIVSYRILQLPGCFATTWIALKQALAAYFQEESIGDVGGKKAKYAPKRGHPGTLVRTFSTHCN